MSHVELMDVVHGDECDTQRNKEQKHKLVLAGFKNLLIVSNPGANMERSGSEYRTTQNNVIRIKNMWKEILEKNFPIKDSEV